MAWIAVASLYSIPVTGPKLAQPGRVVSLVAGPDARREKRVHKGVHVKETMGTGAHRVLWNLCFCHSSEHAAAIFSAQSVVSLPLAFQAII